MKLCGLLETELQINEIIYDFYGKRMAVSFNSRLIRIYNLEEEMKNVSTFQAQENISGICWAHPKFGSLLVSSGDNRVIIWKEIQANNWQELKSSANHSDFVTCIALAHFEYDFTVLSGSYDESIILETYKNEQWEQYKFQRAGFTGVMSIATSPNYHQNLIKFILGANDGQLKISAFLINEKIFQSLHSLQTNSFMIQNVAWGNEFTIAYLTLNTVYVYDTQNEQSQELELHNMRVQNGLKFDQKCKSLMVSVEKGTAVFKLDQQWVFQEILN